MNREGLNPFADYRYRNGTLPSPWARKEWKCFLFDEGYIGNAIRYVRRNPVREKLPVQE